jgi:hypothetical protein
MRVSGSENFQNWRQIGFLFLQNQKNRPAGRFYFFQDSATGQCGASFQQTRTNAGHQEQDPNVSSPAPSDIAGGWAGKSLWVMCGRRPGKNFLTDDIGCGADGP